MMTRFSVHYDALLLRLANEHKRANGDCDWNAILPALQEEMNQFRAPGSLQSRLQWFNKSDIVQQVQFSQSTRDTPYHQKQGQEKLLATEN